MLQCANRLIVSGEKAVVERLSYAARTYDQGGQQQSELDLKVALLCKLIYTSDHKPPLRPPAFGAPTNLPYHSMPITKWPYFPLAMSNEVPFLLISGYELAGHPEGVYDYLLYCKENGIFRTTLFKIPSDQDVKQALQGLIRSERWQSLRWKDSGQNWSYDLHEGSVIEFLQWQTNEAQ